jgi:putative transport protein
MSETAITISLLALVAVIGLWIGHFKIKGVGLGIGGIQKGMCIVHPISFSYRKNLIYHKAAY